MLLFLSLFLAIYGLLNVWLFRRLRGLWPDRRWLRRTLQSLFWIGATGFVAGRFLEKWQPSWFSWLLIAWGGLWFAAVAYGVLFCVAGDLLRLFLRTTSYLPRLKAYLEEHRRQAGHAALFAILLILIGGWINALHPRLHEFTLDIPSARPRPPLRVMLVTDLHLGTLIGRDSATQLAQRINAWEPDLLIFGGDTLDEDVRVVQETGAGEPLHAIRAPLGIWGITGNHEFIGGASAGSAYLAAQGIQMLRDHTALLREDGVWLVGREDYVSRRFHAPPRQSVAALTAHIPENDIVLLLDHQPIAALEAAQAKVALQLSGHTHHGQLWPFQWIVDRVFPVARGLKRIDKTWIYVSSGYGTWGPRVRTSSRPELAGITLRFVSETAPK